MKTLKQNFLSSTEYQRVKKMKGFNPKEWTWLPVQALYKKEKPGVFTVDVSELGKLTEKEIQSTLKKHTKRELLEYLLKWKTLYTINQKLNN